MPQKVIAERPITIILHYNTATTVKVIIAWVENFEKRERQRMGVSETE